MSWAARRRFFVFLIVLGILAVPATLVFYTTIHHTPSCGDRIQNEGERGIDCGGPCPYLCTADEQPPVVLFTKLLPGASGRADVLAMVQNPNPGAAAKAVPYAVTLYDAAQAPVTQVSGAFELPPGATVPLYLSGIDAGAAAPATAFFSVDPSQVKWFTASDTRVIPAVADTTLSGTPARPAVQSVLANPGTEPISDLTVVAVVRDSAGNVIAASRTIVPSLPPQGDATAFFTWNAAFPGMPASIQVIPLVPLP